VGVPLPGCMSDRMSLRASVALPVVGRRAVRGVCKVLSGLGFGDDRRIVAEHLGRTGSCCVLSEDGLPWQGVLGAGSGWGVSSGWVWLSEDGFCAWWKARLEWRVCCLEHEKGIRWMPWHQEAMKDVARCEKPRGAASRR